MYNSEIAITASAPHSPPQPRCLRPHLLRQPINHLQQRIAPRCRVLKIHPCLHAFLHDGAIPEHRLQLRPMHMRVYEGQRTLSRVDILEPHLRLTFLRTTNTCLSPSMAVSPSFRSAAIGVPHSLQANST